ncbi:unnamed protein product [Rotaria magnacalcarata]
MSVYGPYCSTWVSERTVRSHRQNADQKFGGGRSRYLNDEQECYLLSLFNLLPEYGFKTAADVALTISNEYFKSIGLSFIPGRKCLRSFVNHHKTDIKWKKEEKLEKIRAAKFAEETRKSWFSLLNKTLIKLDLMDKPGQIFNCDKTGFSDKTQRMFINKKYCLSLSIFLGTRHVFEKDGGGGKQYTTALIAISAAGQAISPFIVYTGKTLMNTWCRGTIVCLILPPHCTHGLQPIDVVLFNNVKTDWLTIIRNDIKDGNKSIKNSDIPRLMKQLYIEKQSFSTTRIVSSFSRAGIWPFNEHAMMNKVVAPAFSSPSTSTISKTPPPTNILIPRTNSSVVHSSSTTSSSSPKLITVSNVESMDVTLSSDVMMVDGISKRQQQVSFDIQLIKPIEPTFIDAHEIPSSTESTYTVLNTIDFNAAMFEPEREPEPTTQHINQTYSIMLKERNEQTKNPAVQPIDAVREVLVGSLEKQQKHQTTTTTTNFRASRLNNTTGVNITNEDFIRMIQEKASSKTKKTTAKKKTTSIARPTRATTRKKIIIIGVDSDQENDAYMDYESSVRHPGRLIRHRIR